MRKLTFIAAFILIFALLAGYGCDNNNEESIDNNSNPSNDTSADEGGGVDQSELAQWAAFNFDQEISPASGDSGNIKSFTIEVTYTDDEDTRKFQIEGEYLGKSNVDIKTQRTDLSSSEITTVTTNVECYELKHHITALEAPAEDTFPEWVDFTVWIPAGGIDITNLNFWIFPRATYVDSEGSTGEWSYYLTESMRNEMDQGTATYMPFTEGSFNGYDQWTLSGLYGWAWAWFNDYTEGGDSFLEEGSGGLELGGIGYSYSVTSGTEEIDSYSFDAWTVTITGSTTGQSADIEGTFSPDLPLPIFLKVGAVGEESQINFQYELTNLVLE